MQVRNLTITHKKDLKVIVDNLTFSLQPGDCAVMIGEEGNGKSTILKWIADPKKIESYAEWSGSITKGKIGYLAQELEKIEQSQSVYEFCTQEAFFWETSPKELASYAKELNISTELLFSEQRMDTLSGGERIKIQLARLMIAKPEVLLLDEPSNDLDLNTLQWLEGWMRDCSKPILYVSHDERLIEKTANMIIHLEQILKKTTPRCSVVRIPYSEYKIQRVNHLEKLTQEAGNQKRERERQQERFRKVQQKVERDQANVSRQQPHAGKMLKRKMKAVKAMERRFEKEWERRTEVPDTEDAIFIKFGKKASLPAGKIILDIQLPKLTCQNRTLARDIELRVTGNEKICIVGNNGVGKSTLIKKIVQILLERNDIKVGYMPQNYEEELIMQMTPPEYLAVTGEKEEVTKARTYLGSMKYTADEMGHAISELSGGQKAKLFLLKMSIEQCNVLILDEPTRNLSPLSCPIIRKTLGEFPGAMISISHDRSFIHDVCDRVYELTEEGLIELTYITF